MSAIYCIKRLVSRDEIMSLCRSEPGFRLKEETTNDVLFSFTLSEHQCELLWTSGAISTVKAPSEQDYEALRSLAAKLQANVVSEDGDSIPSADAKSYQYVHSISLGWPMMVFVLLVLLVWRW